MLSLAVCLATCCFTGAACGLLNGVNKSAAVSKDVTKYCACAEHATHATTQAITIRIDTQKPID